MPSADQVPTNSSHSRMLWHMWVVLITGSTGSALRAVRPPNLHVAPVVRRDFVHRASAKGSLYRSPLAMCGRLRVGKSFFHILQHWSVQPCVRPFNAVHMTAGHNALRGSGPGQKDAFENNAMA